MNNPWKQKVAFLVICSIFSISLSLLKVVNGHMRNKNININTGKMLNYNMIEKRNVINHSIFVTNMHEVLDSSLMYAFHFICM